MSLTLTISTSDRATPVVLALGRALRSPSLRAVVGRAGVNVYQRHLFGVDNARPNALGGARTHFYADAARGTHFDVLPDGVMISVNQVGYRQRVLGGTIKPTTAKYLTIPARAEAHGKRASEFNDLVVVFGRGGVPVALARAHQTSLRAVAGPATASVLGVRQLARGAEQGGEILFWLKKEVTQRPDPSVAPSTFDLAAGLISEANVYLDRAADRARRGAAGSAPTPS